MTAAGFTLVETARIVADLRVVLARLFELTGGWAHHAVTDNANQAGTWLSTVSRHLGDHFERFEALQPDSELLANRPTGAPSAAAARDLLEQLRGERRDPWWTFALTLGVLLPALESVCAEIESRGAPHCDAALIRAARLLRVDLGDDRRTGHAITASASAGGSGRKLRALLDEAEGRFEAASRALVTDVTQPEPHR